MRKPLFIKKIDRSKMKLGGCLISEYDLGYKGFLGVRWGWLLCRFDMWWLGLTIKHPWVWKIAWFLKRMRFRTYVKDGDLFIQDRVMRQTKKIGRFI